MGYTPEMMLRENSSDGLDILGFDERNFAPSVVYLSTLATVMK